MNNIKSLLFTTLAILFAVPLSARGELVITELMQSNVTVYYDATSNEFPDSWVELMNAGEDEIDLQDYAIGIKEKVSKAYKLPSQIVAPGECILVFCDKVGEGLHTDFRLESNKKGSVYLFKDKEVVSQVNHPAFPAPDLSYGLSPETEEWGYMLMPTPGYENEGLSVDKDMILGNPIFSNKGCLEPDFDFITLFLPEDAPEGTEIHYTLDGSAPTLENSIVESGDTIRLNEGSTVVRARLYKEGWLSPSASTESYIRHFSDINIPIISIVTDSVYLYDERTGILMDRNKHEEWRRPINFEYFEPASDGAAINQICETRIGGNSSRNRPHRTMMVYANKRFGESRLSHEFFPDQKPGLKEFKSVMLRNAGNDYYETYMRDGVAQRSMGLYADIDWQAIQPTIIYINGEYQGLLNLRERSNEDNIWGNYDGLEDIDLVENFDELKSGTWDDFNALWAFCKEDGHTSDEYRNLVDVKEVMDAHLLNLFFNNTDFPGNNTVYWRPIGEGGQWRLIVKDVDYAMGTKFSSNMDVQLPPTFNTVEWLNTPRYEGGGNNWGNLPDRTILFRRLMELDDIREEFLERSLIYRGDFLNERMVTKQINYLDSLISPNWEPHAALYNPDNKYGDRESNMQWMRSWLVERDTIFNKMLVDFYDFGELAHLNIKVFAEDMDISDLKDLKIVFNGIELKTGEFCGDWPVGRGVNLRVSGISNEYSWEVDGNDETPSDPTSPNLFFTMPEKPVTEVVLKLKGNGETGITDINCDGSENEYYSIQGFPCRKISQAPSGIYIEKEGGKVVKKVIN